MEIFYYFDKRINAALEVHINVDDDCTDKILLNGVDVAPWFDGSRDDEIMGAWDRQALQRKNDALVEMVYG